MVFYDKSVQEVERLLKTNFRRGLSASEATKRLTEHGANRLDIKGNPWWKKLLEPFADLFTVILLFASVLSFSQGHHMDGAVVLAIVAISAVIYYAQRYSTERVLKSLKNQTRDKARVLRDGSEQEIDAKDLTLGDVVIFNEGEKVSADCRVISSENLRASESILTGESVPVEKNSQAIRGANLETFDQKNMLFQGSFIVAGTAKAVVVFVGNETELGHIAKLSNPSGMVRSPVQLKIDQLIKNIILGMGVVALVMFVASLARGMELTESLRFVVALSVSAVPEGLPVAISVILVLAMRRMARQKALVRSMRAIETIGVVNTIATDKTGTLTENKLSVQKTWHPKLNKVQFVDFLAKTSLRSSSSYDPLDLAIDDFTGIVANAPRKSYPFNQDLMMSGNLVKEKDALKLYIKGSPERLMELANTSKTKAEPLNQQILKMAKQGLRVIAVASLELRANASEPSDLMEVDFSKLKIWGLLGVADTLRPNVAQAVATTQKAGIVVRMITGDHLETAFQLAKQVGICERRDQAMDCRVLNNLTDKQVAKMIEDKLVFARVSPENKLRILKALKLTNIVGMTGDGVNDVPALSNAHVGLAMGSGAEIAQDASGIILLDDNYATIVGAIEEGRVVTSNILKMLSYLLSTNLGEILLMLFSILLALPLPLSALQILWINLVTDTALVIPLGLEPSEKNVMQIKPRAFDEPILPRFIVSRMSLMSALTATLTLSVFVFFLDEYGLAYAQTMAFLTTAVVQWGAAFGARSHIESAFRRLRVANHSFSLGLIVAIVLQFLASTVWAEYFGLITVETAHLVVVALMAFFAPILLGDLHKLHLRRRRRLA